MDAIKTTGLTKYYGKARGIIDLNLCVPEGEFFGFIGPNGAGKSTTIRTLLGLISPSSGSAEILGAAEVERRSPLELFDEFYALQNNQPLRDVQRAYLQGLIEQIWGGEA